MRKPATLLLALLLAASALSPALATSPKAAELTPAPEGVFQPIPAIVLHPTSIGANMTNTADDYDYPQALYFNGASATVIGLVETLGDYPLTLEDPRGLWARVRIGGTETFPGIVGHIPLAALSFDQTLAAVLPPEVTVAGNGTVDVYLDNGLTDKVAGTLPTGAKANLLGWLRDWAHVSSGQLTGFVRHGDVAMGEELLARFMAVMPEELDEIQPGYQERYAEYDRRITELYDEHGDSNLWPLEVSAQASALAQEFGFTFTSEIHAMPGEGDLSEDEAIAKAKEAARELYGLDEDAFADIGTAFYYLPEAPDAYFWKINLWGAPGGRDVVVRLNRAGGVVEHFSPDGYTPEAEEAYAPDWNDLSAYYYGIPAEPAEGEMTREAAQDKAFTAFQEVMPGANRDDYRIESTFYTDDSGERRWWLVSVVKSFTDEAEAWFMAALPMPDGEPFFTTAAEDYAWEVQWAEAMREFEELTAQRGPFGKWTLEQKVEWDPESYGLPGEGDISQEDAVAKAIAHLAQAEGMTADALNAADTEVYFDIYLGREWLIHFIPREGEGKMEAPVGFAVALDARTGEVTEYFDFVPEWAFDE